MRIQVTEKDIENGERCKSAYCPVALAMSRRLKASIIAGLDGWKVSGVAGQYKPLPRKAIDFMIAFDRDIPVKPIRFEI